MILSKRTLRIFTVPTFHSWSLLGATIYRVKQQTFQNQASRVSTAPINRPETYSPSVTAIT